MGIALKLYAALPALIVNNSNLKLPQGRAVVDGEDDRDWRGAAIRNEPSVRSTFVPACEQL